MPPPPSPVICKGRLDKIDSSKAKVNLLCIPQAGMGAWAFHGWQKAFGEEIEVMPVELPGRNSRAEEPKPTDMPALVASLADDLKKYGAFSKPWVILGHSLGAWVAYELVVEILRRGEASPLLVVVSGVRAPHLSAIEHDADKVMPAISGLDDQSFWREFERRYGINPDLAEASMKEYVLPLIRADFGIVEKYQPSRGLDDPLPVELIACAAAGDDRLLPGQLEAWRPHVLNPNCFKTTTFQDVTALPWSTPHRYVLEDPASLQAFLKAEIERLLTPDDTSMHMLEYLTRDPRTKMSTWTIPPEAPPGWGLGFENGEKWLEEHPFVADPDDELHIEVDEHSAFKPEVDEPGQRPAPSWPTRSSLIFPSAEEAQLEAAAVSSNKSSMHSGHAAGSSAS